MWPPRDRGAIDAESFAESDLREIINSFGITRELLDRIAGLDGVVDPESIVENFYLWLRGRHVHDAFFPSGVSEGVREAQVRYWAEFLRGEIDESYIESRLAVGATHARISLSRKAYTTSMAFCQRWIVHAIRAANFGAEEGIATIHAVSQLCLFDSALVMDAYGLHSKEEVQAEAEKLTAIHSELHRVLIAASEGSFDQRYRPHSGDDVELADAVNTTIEGLASTVRQAKAIAEGKYSEVQVRSERDELGLALAEMTRRLREASEQRERDTWLKQGQAEFFQRMRGELTLEMLGQHVLSYTASRVEAPVASLYVVRVEDEEEGSPAPRRSLELVASFGCAVDTTQKRVDWGEGVLGEAAREARKVWDLDVSSNPVRGTFGFGDIELGHVAILPLVADEQLRGVVQFATLEALGPLAREFLDLVAENVAIALRGALSRAEANCLLQRSREQGEALEAQAEQLRSANEKLAERSDAMERLTRDLEQKNAFLRQERRKVEHTSEALVERAKEVERASAYKSEFLANMSHELRTPLNSMLLLSASLLGNSEGNLSKRQLEALSVIESGGKELLRLIEDVLDLSKVEAGYLSLTIDTARIADVLKSLEQYFRPLAEDCGLEFRLSVDAKAPESFETDPYRLQQILKNLLSNAIKFTSAGSVALHVSVDEAQGSLKFRVDDTGIGISEEMSEDIFEAFQQVDGSAKRRFGGTGLGLTISRHLTELLGGSLQFESEYGVGSSFTLALPLNACCSSDASEQADEVRPIDEAETSAAAQRATSQVLIIEDDETFAGILADMVRDRGFEVAVAKRGRAGIELVERLRPDGVILDMQLPDMDGVEVLSHLKFNAETRDIPVHVLSGFDRSVTAMQFDAASCQKPVSAQELDDILERFDSTRDRSARRLLGDVPRDPELFGKRVLIVDDDPRNVFAMKDVLEKNGLEVLSAKNGQLALDTLAVHGDVDLVIMDIMMPTMDGFEAMRRIRAGEVCPRVPILALTARTQAEDQQACFEAGASAYLSKPVPAEALLTSTRQMLSITSATPATR